MHLQSPYLKKLAAYYYNRAAEWGTGAVINYKHDAFLFGTAVPDVEMRSVRRCEAIFVADRYSDCIKFMVLYRK